MDSTTKRVDGEQLTADCFLFVGVIDDTRTWKLPWKFQARSKRIEHCLNNMRRFNEIAGMPEVARRRAWKRLAGLARVYLGDDVATRPGLLEYLNADQIFDLDRNSVQASAFRRMDELQDEGLVKNFSA